MDSSFELLSTMSPVINKNRNGAHKKVPTKLALNKNIRRSICLDQVINKLHEDTVVLVEDSGDEFGDTSNIIECKDSKNTIITIDSDDDYGEDDTKHFVNRNEKEIVENVNVRDADILAVATSDEDSFNDAENDMLKMGKTEISDSEGEYNDIQNFPKNNKSENILTNVEIAKWIADVNKARTNKLADNSIDDSYVPVTPKCNLINKVNYKSDSDGQDTPISPGAEDILDQLYGESWRKNKDTLFSKSEQRKQTRNEQTNTIFKAQTELIAHQPLKVDKKDLNKQNLFHNFDETNTNGVSKEKAKKPNQSCPKTGLIPTNFDSPLHRALQICSPDTSSSDCESSRNVPDKKKLFRKNGYQKTPKTEPRQKKSNFPIPESPMYRLQQLCDPDTSSDECDTESIKKRLNFHDERDGKNDRNKPNLHLEKLLDDYKKTTKKDTKRNFCDGNDMKKSVLKQNITSPDNLFLISLSADPKSLKTYDVVALMYKNKYKEKKEELSKKLFEIYNRNIFENAIDSDTPLEWNKNLRKTAGLCACRAITHRDGVSERKVRIVLSVKVLDSADRLRDTLLHEMCHAATWIIDKVSGGHGPHWRAWTNKAKIKFPELPEVSVRHDYKINSKYVYKCTNCGYCIYRHTKSFNTQTKRCGYCYGVFEVLLNKVSKRGSIHPVPVTPRKNLNGFAKFVQENYAECRSPSRTHGDVMKLLGEKFAEMKFNKDQ